MLTKTITKRDWIDWIMRQPADKKVNMREPSWQVGEDVCGCLMVQWGRDNMPTASTIDCTICSINGFSSSDRFSGITALLPDSITGFIGRYGFDLASVFSFGDLQKEIREAGDCL